jgi:hypothetical protein
MMVVMGWRGHEFTVDGVRATGSSSLLRLWLKCLHGQVLFCHVEWGAGDWRSKADRTALFLTEHYSKIIRWSCTARFSSPLLHSKKSAQAVLRIRMESGSTCFLASWIRIRTLLPLSRNSKKNLDFYCFVTSF